VRTAGPFGLSGRFGRLVSVTVITYSFEVVQKILSDGRT
jgi:hypothetical protein